MNAVIKFFEIFGLIFVFSNCSFAAYVTDLGPDIDCSTLLVKKAEERLKDSNLVSNKTYFMVFKEIFRDGALKFLIK